MRQALPDTTLGFVVNARGNTAIEQWAKNAKSGYYQAVLQQAAGIPPESLAGILWVQGFNNARDDQYIPKLSQLIADLRQDLGRPELPVVIAQVPIYDDTYPINAQIADAPNHIAKLLSPPMKTPPPLINFIMIASALC